MLDILREKQSPKNADWHEAWHEACDRAKPKGIQANIVTHHACVSSTPPPSSFPDYLPPLPRMSRVSRLWLYRTCALVGDMRVPHRLTASQCMLRVACFWQARVCLCNQRAVCVCCLCVATDEAFSSDLGRRAAALLAQPSLCALWGWPSSTFLYSRTYPSCLLCDTHMPNGVPPLGGMLCI